MSLRRSYALFALASLIFSTTWLAIRIGLEDFRPLGAAGLRFLLAFPILLAYAQARRLAWPAPGREWFLPLGLGLSMFTLPFGLIYFAEQTVPSGLASVLFASHAIFVSVLAHFALADEPLTPARLAGVLVGFAGVVVVFWDRMSGHRSWIGESALLLTALIQAGSSVVVRRTQRGLHPVVLSCIGAAVAATVLLAASFAFEGGPMIRLTAAGVGAIVYLAVFGSVIAFTATIHLLHELGANRVATMVYITPLAALLWGHLFLGEVLGPRLVLGTALVVLGVWLSGRVRRPAPVHPAAAPTAGG